MFATARRVEAMGELAALGIRTLPLDVTSPVSVKTAVEAVAAETGGRIDILINNAGVGLVGCLAVRAAAGVLGNHRNSSCLRLSMHLDNDLGS